MHFVQVAHLLHLFFAPCDAHHCVLFVSVHRPPTSLPSAIVRLSTVDAHLLHFLWPGHFFESPSLFCSVVTFFARNARSCVVIVAGARQQQCATVP